jgi:hypothetical protein
MAVRPLVEERRAFMSNLRKSTITSVALALLGGIIAACAPVSAAGLIGGAASPAVRDWNANALNAYEAPGGGYDSLADFTRDIEGTPCGVTCTQAHRIRPGLPH